MQDLYDVRRDESGWTVVEVATGAPAVVNGERQQGLPFSRADKLADVLNELWRSCPPQRH